MFSTPWQRSKLNISSLIKLDPALRQQCVPGNLQRSLQTSVIQCFQRRPDSRGIRFWYFEVLRLHVQIPTRPTEKLREAQGAQLALGQMHEKPGSQPAARDEHSHPPARQDCQCRRRSKGQACRDGDRQFRAGGIECPRDEALIPWGRQRTQRGQCSLTCHHSCQESEGKANSPRSILTPCLVSPCGCAQPG